MKDAATPLASSSQPLDLLLLLPDSILQQETFTKDLYGRPWPYASQRHPSGVPIMIVGVMGLLG
jgi:hypothetical protein